MNEAEWEQQRFYHRANTAIDAAEAVAYESLAWAWWRQSGPHTPFSSATKVWGFGALGCVGLWFLSMLAQPETEACRLEHKGCGDWSFWMVLFTVLGCICILMMLANHGAECEQQKKQQRPAAAAPATPTSPSPRPSPPPVTQTRVERSVRVVRAPAAATTHHNSQAPVAALQAHHKDVEQSTDLVVIRHHRRPPLWTEDHGAYRSVDRRSFDRDIGPV